TGRDQPNQPRPRPPGTWTRPPAAAHRPRKDHPMSDTWRGEMLRSPELVEAFAGQLRRVLDDVERLVAHVRRDAEPMWREDMPAEDRAIEAALKCRKMTKPLRQIQHHLDAAIEQTFALEARYRRIMHEIPQQRAQERTAGHNRLDRGPQHQPITPGRPRPAQDAPDEQQGGEVSFLDLVRQQRRGSA